MKEKIVNFIKNVAREILYDELEEYENKVNSLQDSNSQLAAESFELSKKYSYLCKTYDELRNEVKNSCKVIIPTSVFNKLISKLPDPNMVGRMLVNVRDTKALDASFKDGCFSCRYKGIRKTSETNIIMEIEVKDAVMGTNTLYFPLTLVNLSSGDGECRTWVWNIWKSGVCVITDDLYNVIYTATEAWTNVKSELLL